MKELTYDNLKETGYDGYLLREGAEKIIQFGEGNFLRGFVDYFIDVMNEKADFGAKVVVVQPIPQGQIEVLNRQEGLYTLYLRGRKGSQIVDEKRVISSISRGIDPYSDFTSFLELAGNDDIEIIISNTTEAGIVYDKTCSFDDEPPVSFPAKLTRLLYERFTRSKGGHGYIILSCELIDDNGRKLRDIVMKHSREWELGDEFNGWLMEKNIFCSTLVDRIVTGYPSADADKMNDENGYGDRLLDMAECFGLWVIEGPSLIGEAIPFKKADLPVMITDDHRPYKLRKVRILNGAHTCMVPVALMWGETIVRDTMRNEYIGGFIRDLVTKEVIPTIPLPEKELISFAEDVFDRFANPFIDHKLKDISLNSISKWNARVKPSLMDFVKRKRCLPERIIFAFASMVVFYKRGDTRDSSEVKNFFSTYVDKGHNEELLEKFLGNESFFGEELRRIKGIKERMLRYMDEIETRGMKEALISFLKEHGDGMD